MGKLVAEVPAILGRLIKESVAWFREGLPEEPKSIEEATKQYKDDQDLLGDFLAEECSSVAPEFKILFKPVFERYGEWCKKNNLEDSQKLKRSDLKSEFLRRGIKVTTARNMLVCSSFLVRHSGFLKP